MGQQAQLGFPQLGSLPVCLCACVLVLFIMGRRRSTALLAKKLNVQNEKEKMPMNLMLEAKDKKWRFDGKRQAKREYKLKRFLSKRKRMNKHERNGSAYKTNEVRQEHSYGENAF